MRCKRPHGCNLRDWCPERGYCKNFDFDGTPMGEEKIKRNREQQKKFEREPYDK